MLFRSVITDIDGNFTLDNVQVGSVIQISYIGYLTKEVKITGNTTELKIALTEDAQSLDEVVVVGYGSEKKVNLTGSVANINMAEMSESRPITDVSQGLAGMAAGVQVTSSSNKPGDNTASIMIRGQGTLNNSAPLVIIDGVEGSLNSVQPQDIENLSVLKDAASAAIARSAPYSVPAAVRSSFRLFRPPFEHDPCASPTPAEPCKTRRCKVFSSVFVSDTAA